MKELIEKINKELTILNEATPLARFNYDDKLSERISKMIVDKNDRTLTTVPLNDDLWNHAYTLALTRAGLDKAPKDIYYVTYLDNNNQKNYITYEGEGKNKRAGFLRLKKRAVIDFNQIKSTTDEAEASLFTDDDINPMIRGLSKNDTYKNVKFKKEKFTGKYETEEMLLADHIIAAYWSAYYQGGASGKFEEFDSEAMKYFDSAIDVIKFAIRNEGNKLVGNYVWEFLDTVIKEHSNFKFDKKSFNYLHDLFIDEKITIPSIKNNNVFSTYVLFNPTIYNGNKYNDILNILNLYNNFKSDSGIAKFDIEGNPLHDVLHAQGKSISKELKVQFAKNMIMKSNSENPIEELAEGNKIDLTKGLLKIDSNNCNKHSVRSVSEIQSLANDLKVIKNNNTEQFDEDFVLYFKVEGKDEKEITSNYDVEEEVLKIKKQTFSFVKDKKATLTYIKKDAALNDFTKDNILIELVKKDKNLEQYIEVSDDEVKAITDFNLKVTFNYDPTNKTLSEVSWEIVKSTEVEQPRSEDETNEGFVVKVNDKEVEVTTLELTDGNKYAYSIKLNKGDVLVTTNDGKALNIEDSNDTEYKSEVTGEYKVYVNADFKVYIVKPEVEDEVVVEEPRTDEEDEDAGITDEELAEGTTLTIIMLDKWLNNNKLNFVRKKGILTLDQTSKNKLTKYIKKCSIESLESIALKDSLLHPAILQTLKEIIEAKRREAATN